MMALMLNPKQNRFVTYGLFMLLITLYVGNTLHAQCARVGWVASVTPGCGAKIIDLDNGQILRAYDGAESLSGGQTIRFTSIPGTLPQGCSSEGYPVVALSCLSDTLPCAAQFGYFVGNQSAFLLHFEANVYDASAQDCSWDFGDGYTAAGNSVQHQFSAAGAYTVCLTVSDAFGCEAEICKEISVSAQNPNDCGYEIAVTAVRTELYGRLTPLTPNPNAVISSVEWYTSKSNQVLSYDPVLTAQLPGYGEQGAGVGREEDRLVARGPGALEHLLDAVERHSALAGSGPPLNHRRALHRPAREPCLILIQPKQEAQEVALLVPNEMFGGRDDEVRLLGNQLKARRKHGVENPRKYIAADRGLEEVLLRLAAEKGRVGSGGDALRFQPVLRDRNGQRLRSRCGFEGEGRRGSSPKHVVEVVVEVRRQLRGLVAIGNDPVGVLLAPAHAQKADPVVSKSIEHAMVTDTKAIDTIPALELLL